MYTSKSRNSRVAKNSFNNVHKPTNLMLVVVFTVVMLVLSNGTILNEDAQGDDFRPLLHAITMTFLFLCNFFSVFARTNMIP